MVEKKKVAKKRVAVKKTIAKKSAVKRKVAVRKVAPKKVAPKKLEEQTVETVDLHQPGAMPLVIYRRIALTFAFVVAVALVSVLYLATVQAVIRVDSVDTVLSTEFVANVYQTPTGDLDIKGTVVSGTLGDTVEVTVIAEATREEDAIATGTVTIYNNMTFEQKLVATTRLLTPDGVLFRLQDGVSVPAGGSVSTEVYADETGASGNISPSTFSIPGLSAARQALVSADSSESFTGGVVYVAVVGQEQIDEVVSNLQDKLLQDAYALLRDETQSEFTGESFDIEILEQAVSVEAGEEAESFEVTISLSVTGVFYDSQILEDVAVRKLYEGLGQGRQFYNIGTQEMSVEVQNFSVEEQFANILVVLEGSVIASQTAEALDVSRFVGMDAQEIESMLVDEGVAESVSVEFFPFWVNSVPRLEDHIFVEIE